MSTIKRGRDTPGTSSTPSRLRRITSISGWPRQRIPNESEGRSTATQNGGGGKLMAGTTGRTPSRSNIRRIASTSSRMFRTTNDVDPVGPIQSNSTNETLLSEDGQKDSYKEPARKPSVVRLRRMASMPARSLKRITSRSTVLPSPPQDVAPAEGTPLSRMKSWSGTVRNGSSSWFRSHRKEADNSRVEHSGTPAEKTRPIRHVHFATAELMPTFDGESSDEDNLSNYHVSLLPSRRHVQDIRDGGDGQEKWWRNDAYYAALAIPIF